MRRTLAALAILVAIGCDDRGSGLSGVTPSTLPAAKLTLLSQPSTVAVNAVITPTIQVAVQAVNNVTITTSTANVAVTLTPGTGAAGAVLSGTSPQTVENGVAIFNNLRIDRAGTGYTLTFSAAGLTSATTAAFDITP